MTFYFSVCCHFKIFQTKITGDLDSKGHKWDFPHQSAGEHWSRSWLQIVLWLFGLHLRRRLRQDAWTHTVAQSECKHNRIRHATKLTEVGSGVCELKVHFRPAGWMLMVFVNSSLSPEQIKLMWSSALPCGDYFTMSSDISEVERIAEGLPPNDVACW